MPLCRPAVVRIVSDSRSQGRLGEPKNCITCVPRVRLHLIRSHNGGPGRSRGPYSIIDFLRELRERLCMAEIVKLVLDVFKGSGYTPAARSVGEMERAFGRR